MAWMVNFYIMAWKKIRRTGVRSHVPLPLGLALAPGTVA